MTKQTYKELYSWELLDEVLTSQSPIYYLDKLTLECGLLKNMPLEVFCEIRNEEYSNSRYFCWTVIFEDEEETETTEDEYPNICEMQEEEE